MILADHEPQWDLVLKGLREEKDYSQSELSEEIGISRRQIGKYERKYRTPNSEMEEKIRNFLKKVDKDLEKLQDLGKNHSDPSTVRTISEPRNMELSEKTGELIGIIIGDGEVKRDGSVRISFNPHNEQEYIEDRTSEIIEEITGKTVRFESEKRIAFNDKRLVLWLKENGITPGSKFEQTWQISERLREIQEVRRGILRGIFDTDGTFRFDGQRLNISFGRFSERSPEVVSLIEDLLEKEEIDYRTSQSKDGRWKIRTSDSIEIRKFFRNVGSSNYKHIYRYLGWRDKNRSIQVTGKSLDEIKSDSVNKELEIPFNCSSEETRRLVRGKDFRRGNEISKIVQEVFEEIGYDGIQDEIDVNKRNIRRWRNGKRTPSPKKCYKLEKMRNR